MEPKWIQNAPTMLPKSDNALKVVPNVFPPPPSHPPLDTRWLRVPGHSNGRFRVTAAGAEFLKQRIFRGTASAPDLLNPLQRDVNGMGNGSNMVPK